MSKKTYLRLGMCSVLVFAFWLLWMPTDVSAAPGGPQEGYGEKDCPTVHKIALGENLTSIAAQYEVSVEALIEENGIKDANLIVENQSLCIPAQHGPGSKGAENEDWKSYGVPGQSYDPSLIRNEGHGPDNGYGPDNGHDPENGDGPNKGYEEEYGAKHEDEDVRYLGVPGKAYDPTMPEGGYWKDDYRYPRPMEDDEIDPNDGDEPVEEPEEPMEPTDPGDENGDETTIP